MKVKVLRRGDKGPAVAALQSLLNGAGVTVNGAKLAEDGIFGSGTEIAVRAFQADRGLKVDGLAGPDTLAAFEGGDDLAVCKPAPAELHPVFARRIARARAAVRRGILYRLGHGGWNPKAELPGRPGPIDAGDRGSGADCSGFIAWDLELPRQHTIVAGLWGISTVSLDRDGRTPGGLFRQISAPVPGCLAVYPDRDGEQGHVGLVTEVSPHLRGIDCSSSRSRKIGEAITERGFEFFRDRGAIWLLRNDDPEPASLGNC